MLKATIAAIFILLSWLAAVGQDVKNLPAMKQKAAYDNTTTTNVYNDSVATSNVIWIKKEVRPHYHQSHTEQAYVIEGTGKMLLGNQILDVRAGDLITIPKGTIHALRVTSSTPMKVLTIHSPSFDGSDRVQVEKSGW
jgi:mannose-6-phosphate isomerase-like protein (cupin superfamily)